jgi:glycosyltransferase involved in cell wall biosynthesis
MRILQVLGNLAYGGAETWMMQILRNLPSDMEMHIIVHAPLPLPGLTYEQEVLALGHKISSCLGWPRQPWKYAHQFTSIVRKHGPFDIVHSHIYLFNGVIMRLAAAANIPKRIAHSHNATPPAQIGRSSLLYTAYEKLMRYWIARYATIGLAASELAASNLFGNNWHIDPKYSVLLHGFDFSKFADYSRIAELRSSLGIPTQRKIIGHIGSFRPVKNHEHLIRVFAKLYQQRQDIHLLLVGDGYLWSDIKTQIHNLGLSEHCSMVGVQSDIASYLGLMDVKCFPSITEGLGIVALEAQAMAVPVIASSSLPTEAIVIPELVERIDLNQRLDFWAERLNHRLNCPKLDAQICLHQVQASAFGIERCLADLRRAYGLD